MERYDYHEGMRKPYHKGGKFNSKLLGLIVLILVVAIATFISSSPSQVKEKTSITGFLVEPSDRSLHVDSVFTDYDVLEFNTSKADSVVVKTSRPSNFKLNEEEIDVSDLTNAEITLTNFEGKIKVKDKKVSVEGFSESLYLNTIGVSKRKSPVNIDFDFDVLRVSNIRLLDQEFGGLSGRLTVAEKSNFDLEDGNVYIKTFKGDVVAEKTLSVSGLADKLSVKNDDYKVDVSQ